MSSKLVLVAGLTGVLSLAGGASAVGIADDFEGYLTQAQFEATWKPLYTGSSLSFWTSNPASPEYNSATIAHSGYASVHGIAPATSTAQNYRYVDDFNAYKAMPGSPMEFSVWVYDMDPSNTGSRNFVTVRAYDTDGFANTPPYQPGMPNFGGTLQALISLGTYGEPSPSKWSARLIGGGQNSWFSLNAARSSGWHKLAAKIYVDKVEFYVDNMLDTTKPLTGPLAPMDAIILGSGLTSNGDDVVFDDVVLTPEPAAALLLAAGGLMLRRRRGA